jgi:hypothetical protein
MQRMVAVPTEGTTRVAGGGARRCQGCGQSARVPSVGLEEHVLIELKFDKATHETGFAAALRRVLWPRGCLHPTHRLALNAEFAALQPMTWMALIMGGYPEREYSVKKKNCPEYSTRLNTVTVTRLGEKL